ncbi:hypothetical protein GBA52_000459 [Prunus armeniaca]|nr:hypothetical protein GBA52_000459 [Prunus armeniaca]
MCDENISPAVFTYTSILGGLGLVGQPNKARDVLKEMNECGCYPDVAAYNAAIRNFCIAKRLGYAYGLMDAMMRCLPNTQSCMFLIRLFRRQEKAAMALQLWNDMVEKGFGSYILKMFLIDMELETLDGPIFRVMPLHAMAHAQQWIDFAGY